MTKNSKGSKVTKTDRRINEVFNDKTREALVKLQNEENIIVLQLKARYEIDYVALPDKKSVHTLVFSTITRPGTPQENETTRAAG